jgi:hypothetical protein
LDLLRLTVPLKRVGMLAWRAGDTRKIAASLNSNSTCWARSCQSCARGDYSRGEMLVNNNTGALWLTPWAARDALGSRSAGGAASLKETQTLTFSPRSRHGYGLSTAR